MRDPRKQQLSVAFHALELLNHMVETAVDGLNFRGAGILGQGIGLFPASQFFSRRTEFRKGSYGSLSEDARA